MTSSPFGDIMQFGYIVNDVEAGIKTWVDHVGAGPFYLIENMPMEHYFYRGVARRPTISMAFGYWGDIQIELIKPMDDEISLYTDAIKAGGAGKLNHCATIVSDLDGLIASRKLQDNIIHYGGAAPNTRFVYLNEFLPGGLHLELIEPPGGSTQGFDGMKAVHERWNGDRPIRSAADLGADLAALAKG